MRGEGDAFHGGAAAEVLHGEGGAVPAGRDVGFPRGEIGAGHFRNEPGDPDFRGFVGGNAASVSQDGNAVRDAGDLVHAVGDVDY